MHYEVLVIGAGLSGLTAASLLAKRGIRVGVVEKSLTPGGSCGIFKRNLVTFDQGSAMLYGFGENGFNAHRFVFNCLEERIEMIKHDLLYCVNFKGKRVRFWANIDQFAEELATVFPAEKDRIKKFYHDLERLYQHVIAENPYYTTPDETEPLIALRSFLRHPVSYIRFLSYLNMSAKELLEKYFTDPEIFKFFDKLTSTYCYTTLQESPAILAAVMFVDNHVGGSFYPAGSTLFLPGKLEKVIEENGGDMVYDSEVVQIDFAGDKPSGVTLESGVKIFADNIIYSGTVWNLYGRLIDEKHTERKRIEWAQRQVPTYPSVVLYAHVDQNLIPADTAPIEMLVGNPDNLDESEVTVYILSIDDRTICDEDSHVLLAIGPTFKSWDDLDDSMYQDQKEKEKERLLTVLEVRFPGIRKGVRHSEVATPKTIERYTLKNKGAVAGPKQMLGQHMLKRLHTKSEWDNLFFCGESTVMGTGTPTVTTSGLSAANAVLKKVGKKPYYYQKDMKNYVQMVEKPYTSEQMFAGYSDDDQGMMAKAHACQYCEDPPCSQGSGIDIPGIMRKITVGNWVGAKKLIHGVLLDEKSRDPWMKRSESVCNLKRQIDKPVEISAVIEHLISLGPDVKKKA